MRYAVINTGTNEWMLESDDLNEAVASRQDGEIVVEVIVDEKGKATKRLPRKSNKDPRAALEAVIMAANANSHPIHYAVKDAINKARNHI
jgi:hypothetical protein